MAADSERARAKNKISQGYQAGGRLFKVPSRQCAPDRWLTARIGSEIAIAVQRNPLLRQGGERSGRWRRMLSRSFETGTEGRERIGTTVDRGTLVPNYLAGRCLKDSRNFLACAVLKSASVAT